MENRNKNGLDHAVEHTECPTMLMGGQALTFLATAPSAFSRIAFPVEIAWLNEGESSAQSRLITPKDEWPLWDDAYLKGSQYELQRLRDKGRSIQRVSFDLAAASRGRTLVVLFPRIEEGWLSELYSARPILRQLRMVSITALAPQVAQAAGLSQDDFIDAAIKPWFQIFVQAPPIERVRAMAQLLENIRSYAFLRGLIDPTKPLEIA